MQLELNFDHLERVKGRIQSAIAEFFDGLEIGQTFHAQDLRDYVCRTAQVAPSSPDRIMRAMRREGTIGYEVVNRRDSLYRKV